MVLYKQRNYTGNNEFTTMDMDTSFLLTIFTLNLFLGFHQLLALPYDYSYTIGCVKKPEAPLYKGGIIVNPELNDGVKGWEAFGSAKIQTAKSHDGNTYVVVSARNTDNDGVSTTFNGERAKIYTFAAWVQASQDKVKVQARLQTGDGSSNVTAGWITAQTGCWKMMKGGFSLNTTAPAKIYFETHSNVTGVDIWVDSVSLQPFTLEEWKSHQDDSREKTRKTSIKFTAVDQNGKAMANATVSIKQLKPNFPWGNAMNGQILEDPTYQKWFLDRFQYTVFENQLKWGYVELNPGVENYSLPDAMLKFAQTNNLTVRGHNVLWDDPKFAMDWLKELKPEELKAAAVKRVNSVVTRYKGQFIHWDVINENMHWDFFSKLDPGKYASGIFKLTNQLDPEPILFLNEYNVVEEPSADGKAVPQPYLDKIAELRDGGYDGPLGIGLQGHFVHYSPNIAYVRASLDMFAPLRLPIWITELDVNDKLPNQPQDLDLLLREFHSHSAVDGILFWASMGKTGKCFVMCMTDVQYKNIRSGDVIDKFMNEFIKVPETKGKTDANGVYEGSLFHGQYEATVILANGAPSPTTQKFELLPKGNVTAIELKVNV